MLAGYDMFLSSLIYSISLRIYASAGECKYCSVTYNMNKQPSLSVRPGAFNNLINCKIFLKNALSMNAYF